MSFSNSCPKISDLGILGVEFENDIVIFEIRTLELYFCTKLCNKTNSRTLISNMAYIFEIPAQKYPNKVFLVPNLEFFFCLRNVAIRQLEAADFKYDKIYSKFSPKRPT